MKSLLAILAIFISVGTAQAITLEELRDRLDKHQAAYERNHVERAPMYVQPMAPPTIVAFPMLPMLQVPRVQLSQQPAYQLPMPQVQRQCYTSPMGNAFYTTCY